MATQCDRSDKTLNKFCDGKDVKSVQLRSQAAGTNGTNLYKGDIVSMCSGCRKSNQGMIKIVEQAK